MKTNTITSKTALINCIIDNVSFKNRKINAEQIGAENFRVWKDYMTDCHKLAYNLYRLTEDHADKSEKTKAKDNLINKIKDIFAEMGDIYLLDKDGNKHATPIKVNDDFVNDIVDLASKYAGKVGTNKAPELQLIESKIRNNKDLLSKYEKLNGVKAETIAAIEQELETLATQKEDLENLPDMKTGRPMMSGAETFRREFEQHLGRFIKGQKAKTWEEKEAEDAAKKAARKAKKAANK